MNPGGSFFFPDEIHDLHGRFECHRSTGAKARDKFPVMNSKDSEIRFGIELVLHQEALNFSQKGRACKHLPRIKGIFP